MFSVATALLFAILALGLLVIAGAAWQGGLAVVAIAAALLAGRMASLAITGVRRARRR